MLEIDGAHGEGGGQLVRTAVALSALTGRAVRLVNVRARRAPPGLAPQHLTAVRAVAQLCAATTDGLEVRTQAFTFRPGRRRGGDYRFDVGTAGSITLVLQAVLPVAVACAAPVHMHLTGGTDVRAAPPLDYFRFVLRPILARMGVSADISLLRRGYYPRGGGQVEVVVRPAPLTPLRIDAPGALCEIGGVAHVANLPAHIGERMRHTAVQILTGYPAAKIETQVLRGEQAIGAGGAIVLWARTDHALLGGAEVAQRGVPAERIAANAAESLRVELAAGATLDLHAADQVLIYAALAQGTSQFLARKLTSHAQTTLWLLEQFLPVTHRATSDGALTRITLLPR